MKHNVNYVEWDKKYQVGIKVIDKQHKHFVDTMNKLFIAIQTDEKDSVLKIIDDLVKYADKHFKTEEAYFEKYSYEHAIEHQLAHHILKQKVDKFLNKKDFEPFETGLKLLDLLDEWLVEHIDKMDRKYIDYFKSKGLK